jgi:hypothetical protein
MKKVLLSLSLITLSVSAFAQNSWVDQGINLPVSYYPREISIVDANTVWTSVGDGSAAATYPKMISRTTNGGATWTSSTVTGPPTSALVGDIFALDANTAWIVTAPVSGTTANGIWKTTNAGSSWTKQTAYSTASFANVIHFWNANEGFSAGDPTGSGANAKFEILRTTNGGTTWTAVANAPAPQGGIEYGLTGVKYVNGNNVWLGTTKGRILRSNDKGVTWSANSTPALDFGGGATGGGVDGSSAQMAFKDANNGLLITVDGLIDATSTPSVALYESADSGVTWEPIETTGYYFNNITYIPGTTNTYVSTGGTYYQDAFMGSSFSTDGGHTWTSIDAGLQRGTVVFLNPTTGWAGQFSDAATGGTKGILKFQGNLLAVSDANANKSKLSIYPNPATDVINLKSSKDIKGVSIFDLSGKIVKQSTGASQVNVSSLAKGNYILQAINKDGSVENTKFIKK